MSSSEHHNNPFSVNIFSIYPDLFPGPLNAGITGKALQKKLWQMNVINMRDYAQDKHQSVDDTPYGGGAGMVMRCDVVDRALSTHHDNQHRLLYVSPSGTPLTQSLVKELSASSGLSIICGRFEGVDQRVLDKWQPLEISLGDYVISGGEMAAYVIIDACLRLQKNVLGNQESLFEESFGDGLLEYPHYTRPKIYDNREVPEILCNGNHAAIAAWRHRQAKKITAQRRPDLWQQYIYKETQKTENSNERNY